MTGTNPDFALAPLKSALVLAAGLAAFGNPAYSAPAKTKPIVFEISNQACFKGSGIAPYINQAIAQRKRAASQSDASELKSSYVRVPARPWHGLTVTGIGLHYETTSVYFREPEAEVRRVLLRKGVRVEANGNIPISNEEGVEVQRLSTTDQDSRRYGASEVTCGV